MSPTDLGDIIQQHPDQRIRLTLSSGDSVIIPHANAVRISGTSVTIFTGLERGRLVYDGRPQYVSTVNIALAEPMPDSHSPESN